ncbi:hypothetical protein tb265_44020 [Gemmatimonadetes bacterium T265]|nr:hypothetical protein tb265_44020 [Gemmatimonadetes bacterium T265]
MSAPFLSSPLAACQRVGRGARVRGRPVVENLGQITIGHALVLSATPIPTHLVTGTGAALDIGDRVTIGHGVGITAHAGVHVGDDVVVGPFAMILDTDFHVVGDHDARPECTPIRIGNGVTIGAHVTVLRGSVIGDGASVAPGSVVAGHVPAGARVSGNPARADSVGEDHAAAPADAVPAIVARTLGLAAVPRPDDACQAIPGWDSLGMLNVLLSLEAAFDVELRPDAIARVRRVRDLVDVVLGTDRAAAGAAA